MSVILFHAGFPEFSGGFVGVDIFFVISGYLITRILLQELRENRFSLARFYERRIRRILPVLYFVLLTSSIAAWLWLLPSEFQRHGKSLLAVIFFVSNFLYWREGDYFDVQSEYKPLLHTWSLAVEEQYYLLFPLLMLSVWRFRRNRVVIYLIVFTLLSFFLAELASYLKPKAAFFLVPTRAWELMAGSLAACYSFNNVKLTRFDEYQGSMAGVGLVLIIYAIFAFDKSTRFPGVWALFPVFGALLIILFAHNANAIGKLLSSRVLVGIGLLSYSAYLWHQPMLVFFRQRMLSEPSRVEGAVLIVAIFVISYFSWRYIENPFRNKSLVGSKTVYAAMGIASTVLVGVGFVSISQNGAHARLSAYIDHSAERNKLPLISNGWCFYSVDTIQSLDVGEKGRTCYLGAKNAAKKALLFGDSFAGQYEPFWDELGKQVDLSIHAVSTNWCYPTLTQEFTGSQTSRAYQQCLENRKFLQENMHRYDILILSGYWRQILLQEKMTGVLDLVTHAAGRMPLIVIMGSPVVFDENINIRQQLANIYGRSYSVDDIARSSDVAAVTADKILNDLTDGLENVVVFSRDDLFGRGSAARLATNGQPYSWDGYHISILGSRRAFENFLLSDKFSNFSELLKSH